MWQGMQAFQKMPGSEEVVPQSYNCEELNSTNDEDQLESGIYFYLLQPLDENSVPNNSKISALPFAELRTQL